MATTEEIRAFVRDNLNQMTMLWPRNSMSPKSRSFVPSPTIEPLNSILLAGKSRFVALRRSARFMSSSQTVPLPWRLSVSSAASAWRASFSTSRPIPWTCTFAGKNRGHLRRRKAQPSRRQEHVQLSILRPLGHAAFKVFLNFGGAISSERAERFTQMRDGFRKR